MTNNDEWGKYPKVWEVIETKTNYESEEMYGRSLRPKLIMNQKNKCVWEAINADTTITAA